MDTAHQSKNRLLLVDGDPKSLRVLDVSLKKSGFEVATATSGREALNLLEACLPDLIISDTDLDEMDGFELCSQIKARPEWAKIPFLFVSGRKSIEDKIRGLELGVDDYLTKPIYIKEIGIRVRTALQRAERERMESRREGRTRFAGDLSDVGVVDLVQTIELNRKSGIIHIVNRDGRRGSIFFRDGKVIDAEVGRLSGANAIYRLFSWSEGQFAVEFKQIRRHDVIDTPMAPLLMEGMRRLDESAHLLEKLPSPSSVIEVDCRVLAEELVELPDEMNSVLRLCDGARTLQEVVEDSDHPDLEALNIINKLFTGQIVFAREAPDRGGESEPSERLARWLSEGGAEDGAAAEETSASSEYAAPMDFEVDSEVVPAVTPAPDSAVKREGSETDPAQTKATVSLGEGLVHLKAVEEISVEPSPSTPWPAADQREVATEATIAGVRAAPQELMLSAEESLGAALLPRAEATTEDSSEFAKPADTLKGVRVDNLFSDQETKADRVLPQIEQVAKATAQAPEEARTTNTLGLAERLLSEDSVLRASAMHEAIGEDGGKVAGPQSSERNTREYGNPVAEAAAALVHKVVSSANEITREGLLPTEPERPIKEVDWGAWPTNAVADPKSAGQTAVVPPKLPRDVGQAALLPENSPSAEDGGALSAAISSRQSIPDLPREVKAPPPLPADESRGKHTVDKNANRPEPLSASSLVGAAGSVLVLTSAEIPANQAAESASALLRPSTLTPADGSLIPRKAGHARQVWLSIVGAFVVGVVGFLVFSGKAFPPSRVASQPALPAASPRGRALEPAQDSRVSKPPVSAVPRSVKPPSVPPSVELPSPPPSAPVPDSAKAKAAAKPLAAHVRIDKPEKGPLELGVLPSAPADLRRRCLETDADGKGKAKAVSAACQPALDADPKDVDVMVILARASIDRGRLGEARSLAKKALATDPQRFEAYVFLGTAEQEAGRIDEARAAYKKYLELAPDGPFARQLRAILNNL